MRAEDELDGNIVDRNRVYESERRRPSSLWEWMNGTTTVIHDVETTVSTTATGYDVLVAEEEIFLRLQRSYMRNPASIRDDIENMARRIRQLDESQDLPIRTNIQAGPPKKGKRGKIRRW